MSTAPSSTRASSANPTTTPSTSYQRASTSTSTSASASASTINRNRQYTHLHAQLAQLNAHVADMENLVGMTAVQAEYMRGLGGWWGGAFMAASKVLGEETANGAGAGAASGEKSKPGQK
ncbi:hypothetical protein P7C71_g1058, partial [Lecanoromycetidae sp. Uapishka_2]